MFFVENIELQNGDQERDKDSTWICRNSAIHTNVNILVTMKELIFIHNLVDSIRHDYLNTLEPVQCGRTMKRG